MARISLRDVTMFFALGITRKLVSRALSTEVLTGIVAASANSSTNSSIVTVGGSVLRGGECGAAWRAVHPA